MKGSKRTGSASVGSCWSLCFPLFSYPFSSGPFFALGLLPLLFGFVLPVDFFFLAMMGGVSEAGEKLDGERG